jgi:hypothetical protein
MNNLKIRRRKKSKTKNIAPDWQTVKRAAPRLNLSEQGLYAAIREKQLPEEAILKIGRRLRINLNAL